MAKDTEDDLRTMMGYVENNQYFQFYLNSVNILNKVFYQCELNDKVGELLAFCMVHDCTYMSLLTNFDYNLYKYFSSIQEVTTIISQMVTNENPTEGLRLIRGLGYYMGLMFTSTIGYSPKYG